MRMPSNYLTGMIAVAEEYGANPEQLRNAAGIRQEILDDPGAGVEYELVRKLVEASLEGTGRPGLALEIGNRFTITNHGLLGYAAMSSATLGEALFMTTKYLQTRLPVLVATYAVEKRAACIRLEEAAVLGDVRPSMYELVLSAVHSMALFLTGGTFKYSSLILAYPEPSYSDEYRQLFGCRLEFGADVTEARFDASLMSVTLPFADEVAKTQAAERCEEELAAIAESDDIEQQVRVRLLKWKMNESVPTLDEVASGLGMSARTLRRRLQDNDTSYQKVLNSVRKELALQYLHVGGVSVAEVSDRLGYSDQSAFGRAFKGWTGRSPQNFKAAD